MQSRRTIEQKLDLAFAGHPGSARLRKVMLSHEEARNFERALAVVPISRKRCELMVEYAERRGGLILELLQLTDGPCWGTAIVLTVPQCALALEVEEAELVRLYDEMLNAIRPALIDSPEFLASTEETVLEAREATIACNRRCEAARAVCEASAQDALARGFSEAGGNEVAETAATIVFRDSLVHCREEYDRCLTRCREMRR